VATTVTDILLASNNDIDNESAAKRIKHNQCDQAVREEGINTSTSTDISTASDITDSSSTSQTQVSDNELKVTSALASSPLTSSSPA